MTTFKDQHQRRTDMILALGLFDLTAEDRGLLDWLASWDQTTTDRVADLFARLRRPPLRSSDRAPRRSDRVPEPSQPCIRCGLPADALIHHATANGHDFTTDPARH